MYYHCAQCGRNTNAVGGTAFSVTDRMFRIFLKSAARAQLPVSIRAEDGRVIVKVGSSKWMTINEAMSELRVDGQS